MILRCPKCGEQYEIQSKSSLDGFTMKCQSCGTEISANEEIKITPLGDAYAIPKKKRSSCWKWALSIILVLIGTMMFTRPSKEKHAEKIREFALLAMNQNIQDQDDTTQGLAFLFGPWFMDRIMDMGLQIDDYFLFNVGRIQYDDLDKTVTVGLFNNVILLVDKDTLKLEEDN